MLGLKLIHVSKRGFWQHQEPQHQQPSILTQFAWNHPGCCYTNVLRALQNNLAKINSARNSIYVENFKLKLCACAKSMALGTGTKFQLEIRTRSTISAIHKFQENILKSSWNVSEAIRGLTEIPFYLSLIWMIIQQDSFPYLSPSFQFSAGLRWHEDDLKFLLLVELLANRVGLLHGRQHLNKILLDQHVIWWQRRKLNINSLVPGRCSCILN